MTAKPKYSIVVPTHNEHENIAIAVCLLIKHLETENTEIIVVDSGSTDGTREIVQKMQEAFPDAGLVLLEQKHKCGLGNAYRHALPSIRGEFVVLMDADLSHHPKHIPEFIRRQKETGADIVLGTRYSGKTAGICGWGLRRKIFSRGANTFAGMLLGISYSDLTGSFRLYRRSTFFSLIKESAATGFGFQMEILFLAANRRCTVAEVPIRFVDRLYGTSKFGLGEIVAFLCGLHLILCKETS